jgi:tetratricopeptide (TPR) repeat protein
MSEEAPKGWILHSKGRKFGPLTEDELRGYFRAGMVQSVDRLTPPGQVDLRAAGEVALELGLKPPPGPPPEPLAPPAPPAPPSASPNLAGTPFDPAREERAAKALAAMNIDFAAMAASGSPSRKERNPWIGPMVAVVALVALLIVALNMLHKLKNAGPGVAQPGIEQVPPVGAPLDDERAGMDSDANAPRPLPTPGAAPAGASAPDAVLAERMQKAQTLAQGNDWAGLVRHAQEWSREQPERNEPLQSLGIAYAKLGNYAGAADALKRILARDPGNVEAQTTLADVYAQDKQWAEAAAIYRDMVKVDSQNSRLWNNYGATLTEMGQPAQAVAALETAVRLDPQFKEGWINLGNTYQRMGDNARAAAAFANAKR